MRLQTELRHTQLYMYTCRYVHLQVHKLLAMVESPDYHVEADDLRPTAVHVRMHIWVTAWSGSVTFDDVRMRTCNPHIRAGNTKLST